MNLTSPIPPKVVGKDHYYFHFLGEETIPHTWKQQSRGLIIQRQLRQNASDDVVMRVMLTLLMPVTMMLMTVTTVVILVLMTANIHRRLPSAPHVINGPPFSCSLSTTSCLVGLLLGLLSN